MPREAEEDSNDKFETDDRQSPPEEDSNDRTDTVVANRSHDSPSTE